MKKTYCKPQIIFEDFELTANIANGCRHSAGHNRTSCGYTVPGIGKLFTGSVTIGSCNIQVYTDGAYGLCYHLPMERNSVYAS